MSLSKQLLILISFIFFIVFSVSFLLSIDNIKSYLEVESEIHVQDTATSLGLSLSPHMVDEQDPILRTMMNAIFDTGYYKEMRLVNVDGDDLIKLTNPARIEGVPSWLLTLVPMKTATAVSEISSGWSISGTLYVSSNPGYGYLKLYQQGKATLTYSLLLFFCAVVLLVFALRMTLRSLKDIEKQATEISSGQFTVIKKLPWTLEVRNVAKSMNSMSDKIGGMISRLNGKLESLSDNLKRDPLTGLFNQSTFDEDFKHSLAAGDTGYAAFIKIDELAKIAKDQGNQSVDQLLIEFATLLNSIELNGMTTYRLYGSEFALLCPKIEQKELSGLANKLQNAISELASSYSIDDLVHIGIARYDRTSEFNKLMPALLEAYEQAKNIGNNAYFVKEDIDSSMTDLEWKAAILSCIENNTPEITFTAQAYDFRGKKEVKVMEEAFTVVKDHQGTSLSIGTFFSMAQEFDLVEEMDKCIVNKIISLMEETKHSTPVTINLSMVSVSSVDFKSWLQSRLATSTLKHELLAFSVTAYSAAKDLTAFANFSVFVKSFGATTLLKRYSSDIIAVDMLKDLHIDYVRLARDLTSDIRGNSSKPDFLELMQEVSSLLDIKVLAEGVTADDDFKAVKKIGLFGISR
ncbi:signal protein [Methylophaga sp. 42_25_T18]|nr:signal protein [Methylophaga sp. 42_25_T18]